MRKVITAKFNMDDEEEFLAQKYLIADENHQKLQDNNPQVQINEDSFMNCTMSTTKEGKVEVIYESIKTNKDFDEQKKEFKQSMLEYNYQVPQNMKKRPWQKNKFSTVIKARKSRGDLNDEIPSFLENNPLKDKLKEENHSIKKNTMRSYFQII